MILTQYPHVNNLISQTDLDAISLFIRMKTWNTLTEHRANFTVDYDVSAELMAIADLLHFTILVYIENPLTILGDSLKELIQDSIDILDTLASQIEDDSYVGGDLILGLKVIHLVLSEDFIDVDVLLDESLQFEKLIESLNTVHEVTNRFALSE
mgnify:CR=1 FL=1